MNSGFLKKALPHLIAVGIFLVVALVYCKPALDGKVLNQSDYMHWKAMSQQSVEYKEKYGHYPLWTESMFSGMPTYNIAMEAKSSLAVSTGYLSYLVSWGLPKPINFFFIACICFYLLTQVLRINPWIGIATALAYSYSTFDPVIIVVGHDTEMLAIGYAPAVIAGVLLLFQRRYALGLALFTLFFSFQFGTQHLQIIYYTGIIIGLIILSQLILGYRQKTLKDTAMAIALTVVGGLIGFGCFAVTLLPTKEYAKESIRGGKSELKQEDPKNKSKGGLNKDYAFNWSYGITEVLTLAVPGMYGGGAESSEITSNSKFVEKLTDLGVPEEQSYQNLNSSLYWGDQPFTGGAVYFGAVICFLFFLGMVYTKRQFKWWILATAVIGIILAWGKNFSTVNYFLFDYLPLYNKFRAPTMALVMPQFAFPLLAALGLNELLTNNESSEINWARFKKVLFISAGFAVLLGVIYLMSSFKGPGDARVKDYFTNLILRQASQGKQPTPAIQQQATEFGSSLVKAIQEDRKSVFSSDLLRTIIFMALAAILAGLFIRKKITSTILLAGILVLSSYDLLAVGKRYLNEGKFLESAEYESNFTPNAADIQIKKDPEKGFRVVDETEGDPLESSRASYFHNSVGGYHPAKLALYEDLIEQQLSKGNMRVFDMLNAKYFIQRNPQNGQAVASVNPNAFGPCWLVKQLDYVRDADAEMKALDSTNLRDTAVLEEKYKAIIKFAPVPDSSASLKLIENLNDKIDYRFSAKTNQFAVFSEVYYDKGWNAYLDGNKTDYVRVNYVLRGMPVPAGEHKIEFRFEPASYDTGNTISLVTNMLTFLLILVAIIVEGKRAKQIPGTNKHAHA